MGGSVVRCVGDVDVCGGAEKQFLKKDGDRFWLYGRNLSLPLFTFFFLLCFSSLLLVKILYFFLYRQSLYTWYKDL